MHIKSTSVAEYLSKIPEDRQPVVSRMLDIFRSNLPEGFEEGLGYGMPAFYVPHSLYPSGYHCDPKQPLPFISVASQKNFIALYHMGMYAKPELHKWWVEEYPKHAKRKLDMGKSCVRFKNLQDIPWALIEELATKMTAQEWIDIYEAEIKR